MADHSSTVAFSFAQFLVGLKEKGTYDASSLDATVKSIQETFGFSLTDSNDFKKLSVFPSTVTDVFAAGATAMDLQPYEGSLAAAEDNTKFAPFVETVTKKGYYAGAEPDTIEYLQRHAKVILKFKQKVGTKTAAAVDEAAEKKKADGNAAMAAKDYKLSITRYTEALELSAEGPNSHIYLTNRAAAQCFLHNYELAVTDCELAVSLCPGYVKAYSRLGLANFFMNKFDKAIEAYQSAVDLEPENKNSQNALRQAIQKKEEQDGKSSGNSLSSSAGGASSSGTMPGSGAGGMPDMSALAGMMGGAGGGGIAEMMKNPQMMAAAQQMMQNPAMMQQAMSMMGGMGGAPGAGGAGGKPDMAALAAMMGNMKK